MKKYALFIIVLALLFLSLASPALQNGYDLFQKALAKERAEGNLEEAITLYQKVIGETKDKSLTAKAQLRIGICFEKLGKQEAQKAYQKVIDNYPQQTEAVKMAKKKLSNLIKARSIAEKGDNEFKIEVVCLSRSGILKVHLLLIPSICLLWIGIQGISLIER